MSASSSLGLLALPFLATVLTTSQAAATPASLRSRSGPALSVAQTLISQRPNLRRHANAPSVVTRSRLTEEDLMMKTMIDHPEQFNQLVAKREGKNDLGKKLLAGILAAGALPGAALAKGGEFGGLEGGVPALVHPIMMGGLYAATLYAGFLGWQIRRMRELADEISGMKSQAPKLSTPGESYSSPVGPLIEKLQGQLAGADATTKTSIESDIKALQAFAPTDAEIVSLSATRKDLVKGDFRDKHFQWGSLILALGVGFAIEGPVNTWMRTGKLFPGPHLFAGAGIVVLWAAAAGLVPAMQKGNKLAKDLHVALNAANVGLFSWQIASGIPIVQKVLEIKFGIKL